MDCEVKWTIMQLAGAVVRPDLHSVRIPEPSDRDQPGWRDTVVVEPNCGDPRAVFHISGEKYPIDPLGDVIGRDRSAPSHQSSGSVHDGEVRAGAARRSSFKFSGSGFCGKIRFGHQFSSCVLY
jgi:hypothetical protein